MCREYLAIPMPFAQFSLFRMIKPFHFHNHIAGPRFPKTLNAANIRKVRAARRQKYCTVANSDYVFTPDDGLVEKFSCFSFQTSPLKKTDNFILGTRGIRKFFKDQNTITSD